MPPTPEGTDLKVFPFTPNPNDCSAVSIYGRDLVCQNRARPLVVVTEPDGYSTYNAGITGPFAALTETTDITFPAGNLKDSVRVMIARYDSARLVSNASATAFASIVSNPCEIYPATGWQTLVDQSISINLSGFTKMQGDEATDVYDKFVVILAIASAKDVYIVGSVPVDTETTLTNVALTSNVATITVSDITRFAVGSVVTVDASDNIFDGSYTITAVDTSAKTISYALTHANVPSAAATGTVTITGGVAFTFNSTNLQVTLADKPKYLVGDTNISAAYLPLPSVAVVRPLSMGDKSRFFGVAPAGYDCFADQPRLAYYSPTADGGIGADGTVTFNTSDSLASYKASPYEYIVTAYNSENQEIVRGYIGAGGNSDQLVIYTDLGRTTLLTYDNDAGGTVTSQRWEIRKHIVAKVTQGSREVLLYTTYDASGSPVEVAPQYWNYQQCSVGALGGVDIYKPATSGGSYTYSLDSTKTLGNSLVLFSVWPGASGYGLLTVKPYNRRVWVGQGAASAWECTGDKWWYNVGMIAPIKTMDLCKLAWALIGETKEIVTFALDGVTLVDPVNLLQYASFNIAQFAATRTTSFDGTCCSRATATTPDGDMYFVMFEGPACWDGGSVTNLVENRERNRWGGFYGPRLNEVFPVYDPGHRFAPIIRFMGIPLNATGGGGTELWFNLVTKSIVLSTNGRASAGAYIAQTGGTGRIVFGGNGRLWSGGMPSRIGQSNRSKDYYATPVVLGAQQAGVDSANSSASITAGNTGYVGILGDVPFCTFGQGYYYTNAGILVYKINCDSNSDLYNTWEVALVTSVDPEGFKLNIYALTDWTVRDFDRIEIGPREVLYSSDYLIGTGDSHFTEVTEFIAKITDDVTETAAITTKAITSNVATLGLSSVPSALVVGTPIVVAMSPNDPTFVGPHIVTAVTSDSISFALTADNLAEESVEGGVVYFNQWPLHMVIWGSRSYGEQIVTPTPQTQIFEGYFNRNQLRDQSFGNNLACGTDSAIWVRINALAPVDGTMEFRQLGLTLQDTD